MRWTKPTAGLSWAGLIRAGLVLSVWTLALAGPAMAQDAPPLPDTAAPFNEFPTEPMAALAEGNRLFRDGLIAEATEAYRAGYDPAAPHPTLVYNLGTALHHLDRLPEAILWYRRGAESDDPWLEENLWLARRTLGSQVLPAPGALDLLARYAPSLRIAGVIAAWLAFAVLLFAERGRALALSIFVIAGALYATAAIAGHQGSEPAVLLEDCATSAGDLPAGTEVWAKQRPDGDWRIAARSDSAICPASAVTPVAARPGD